MTSLPDPYLKQRQELLRVIEGEVRRFGTGDGGHELDPRVKQALLAVPRERFVPEQDAARAFVNRPLPIGHGQTISQPLIVALMTHHLHLQPEHRVLEVGTGSGYQAAVLAELAAEVVTVEVVEDLARVARERLDDLGYRNIVFRVGDGAQGAPDLAPFAGILVTAAASEIPVPLVDQLAPGGRMVIPLGRSFPDSQDLVLVEKAEDGAVSERWLFPVAFVPLTGGHRRPG
jgi:protein-L-isoaspartate(D-aspartate) O-methyltransferase